MEYIYREMPVEVFEDDGVVEFVPNLDNIDHGEDVQRNISFLMSRTVSSHSEEIYPIAIWEFCNNYYPYSENDYYSFATLYYNEINKKYIMVIEADIDLYYNYLQIFKKILNLQNQHYDYILSKDDFLKQLNIIL